MSRYKLPEAACRRAQALVNDPLQAVPPSKCSRGSYLSLGSVAGRVDLASSFSSALSWLVPALLEDMRQAEPSHAGLVICVLFTAEMVVPLHSFLRSALRGNSVPT